MSTTKSVRMDERTTICCMVGTSPQKLCAHQFDECQHKNPTPMGASDAQRLAVTAGCSGRPPACLRSPCCGWIGGSRRHATPRHHFYAEPAQAWLRVYGAVSDMALECALSILGTWINMDHINTCNWMRNWMNKNLQCASLFFFVS